MNKSIKFLIIINTVLLISAFLIGISINNTEIDKPKEIISDSILLCSNPIEVDNYYYCNIDDVIQNG